MTEKSLEKLMRQEEKLFGIKQGFQTYSPYPFGGMDQQSSRQGMEDNKFFYLENYIKIGQGSLRALWDIGNARYTAPIGKTIVFYSFFNIGNTNYVAIFLSDGTAIQVDTAVGTQTIISSTLNLFYSGSQLPACGQWGSQYLIIANNNTPNDYWIWDGATLYGAGSLGPIEVITAGGSGYTSVPTVTIYGGAGTGAIATAQVVNGSVTSFSITNPGSGYSINDQVQVLFTGGGTDSGARLTARLVSTSTVQSVIVTAGGTGYTSAPVISFTGGGGGTGAAAFATLTAGVVTSITITAGGSGYTDSPTVVFTGGAGTGASASAFLSSQPVNDVLIVNGGTGFTGTPTLTFIGGGGTGASATATVTGGVITAVTMINNGSGYTSAPAVVVQSGINKAASGTVSLMPFGISGTSIETFQQRVWLPHPNQTGTNVTGGVFSVTAPGSITNFSTSSGGVTFTNTDSFLRSAYTNIKQSNGYLYPIGDSSVSVISNVQTSGSPPTTTFNYQNTDPQIGTSWRDTVQPYSRTVLFTNIFGVFGLYGGAVSKISQQMDNVFDNAVYTGAGVVTPSSAVANIFNLKVYMVNVTISDPFTQAQRTVMIGWDEKEWYILSQSSPFIFIASQEINSDMFAWGTDGNSLYPLFNTPSTLLTKKLSTKLYGNSNFLIQKEAMGVYAQVQDLSGSGVVFSSVVMDTEHGSYPVPAIPSIPEAPLPKYAVISMGSGDVYGVNLGMTITSNSADYTLNYLGCGYIDTGSIAMGSTPINGQIATE